MTNDFNIFQSEVNEWQRRNFPVEDSTERALVLCEEAGEVARAVLKRKQGIRGTEEEWTEQLLKELGDVLICVAATCANEGVSLGDIVDARWNEIKLRDYVNNPQQHGIEDD